MVNIDNTKYKIFYHFYGFNFFVRLWLLTSLIQYKVNILSGNQGLSSQCRHLSVFFFTNCCIGYDLLVLPNAAIILTKLTTEIYKIYHRILLTNSTQIPWQVTSGKSSPLSSRRHQGGFSSQVTVIPSILHTLECNTRYLLV